MDKKLLEFEGDINGSELAWDAKKFPNLKGHLEFVKNPEMKQMITKIFFEYEANLPKLNKLRQSLTHNDANDTNTIMESSGKEVLAFIDLGDSIISYTINDLAVGCVYFLFKQKDYLFALEHIVRGYSMIYNILPEEIEMLPFLMKVRLCTSLLMSSYTNAMNPNNEYILSSQSSAWNLLQFLEKDVHPNYVYYLLRRSCHYKYYCPQEETLIKYCASEEFAPIFNFDFKNPETFHLLDLSITSEIHQEMPKNVEKQTEFILNLLKSNKKCLAIGRYNEERGIYTTENYKVSKDESRTIHLGIDLFTQPNTPIYCPLDGSVLCFEDRDIPLDYGPMIILQHEIKEHNLVFYTVYGHLTKESLQDLHKGKKIYKGMIIGYVGNYPTNGNWPPHVHFQLINDMFYNGSDYIGVAAKSKRDLWLSICPNPNIILKIPEKCFSNAKYYPNQILSQRDQNICKALSISYDEPLYMIKGSMQYLFNDQNHLYLDGVNNVAHLGHSHPKLVNPIARQFSLINSNTRYLSSELFEYTSELLKTFPIEFDTCFLTNSGSEANDLALRLARAYTNRKDIMVINHAYHGNLTSLIEISPYKFQGKGGFPCPDYIHIAEIPDGFRGQFKYDDKEIGKKYAKNVGEIIQKNPNKCAAFIAESILGCGGQIVLPEGYLKEVYEKVRNDGGLCIADEVQVGFGRVGNKMWAFETQNVIPDLVTLGKPIGNGYPIGAVITKKVIADKFANGMEYFNTFGGSNASCVVGYHVLKILKEEKLQENARFLGKVLIDGLNEMKNSFEIIGDVRGIGLFIGIELVKDKKSIIPAADETKWIVEYMKNEESILLSTDGPYHNVIKIKPPLCWNLENCGSLLAGLTRAFLCLSSKNANKKI